MKSAPSLQVYLVDCDSEALELARENVDMLVEEDVIGRSTANEGGAPGCLGVELIMAKVKHVPPKKRNNEGGGGRGHRGGRGGRGASGKKGKHGGIFSASSTSQDDSLYVDPRENVDDGIPLNSKIVDTVITKYVHFDCFCYSHLLHSSYYLCFDLVHHLERRTMKE